MHMIVWIKGKKSLCHFSIASNFLRKLKLLGALHFHFIIYSERVIKITGRLL